MTEAEVQDRLDALVPWLSPEERGRVVASAQEAVSAAARLRLWLDAQGAPEGAGEP